MTTALMINPNLTQKISVWANPTEGKTLRVASFCFSIFLHLILFFAGGALISRSAEYGVALSQGGMEIELVAGAHSTPATQAQPADNLPAKMENAEELSTGKDAITFSSAGNGEVDEKPGYLKNPPPPYPRSAILNNQEGLVKLSVLVNRAGYPETVVIQESSGVQALDESALKSVKKWRFKSAHTAGLAQSTQVLIPVRFRLEDAKNSY